MGQPGATRTDSESGSKAALLRPVVLIGLMGAGKTSVGLRLANALGVEAIDSDTEIERAAAMTIPEIFERFGEPHFRSGERRVLARLMGEHPRIISAGGGAFMDPETRALIKRDGISVWLKAELDVLVQRTAGRSHRPLLNSGDPRQILSNLIDVRYPVYAEADLAVPSLAGQTHDDMAARIIQALKTDGRAFPKPSGGAP
ncbi:MAG: shikimate kinase [Pseudomonadota bacterium]